MITQIGAYSTSHKVYTGNPVLSDPKDAMLLVGIQIFSIDE